MLINNVQFKMIISVIICSALSACSMYHPLPLPAQTHFSQKNIRLTVNKKIFPFAPMKRHVISVDKPLDITDVAMLAVTNNLDLLLARDQAHIAQAQAFAAGLLPDPKLDFSRLYPITPGDIKGFNVGLSQDFLSMLHYSAHKNAAIAAQKQVDLNLLWKEWQTISQSKILFIKIVTEQKQLFILKKYNKIMMDAFYRVQKSVQQGDMTLNTLGVSLIDLQSAITQIYTLQISLNKDEHDLNNLLNLLPETKLKLAYSFHVNTINPKKILVNLKKVVNFRPDLLALKSGYESQNYRYRQAIIDQFPMINIGFSRSTDTTNAQYYGFGITFNIPIFNRNRGNIAIEKATRQKLYDDFQYRLNTTTNTIYKLMDEQKLLITQYRETDFRLMTLEKLMRVSKKAYQQGNITILDYSTILSNIMNAKIQEISIQSLLAQEQIALETLLGTAS